MVEKIQTDVDRLLLVSKLKKSPVLAKYMGEFFFLVSKRKDLMKIPKVIFHIKPIPSHMMRMYKCVQQSVMED